MSIVGGLDIHRNQLTFDWLNKDSGRWERGRIAPADREHLARWLTQFGAGARVAFALEGCTGWRYVVDELAKVGGQPHLPEPADTATLRGPKRRAKSDRADARHLRELLDVGMLPECYIPPDRVLEWRATLELYSDLRIEHSGWVQRIHAVCFHQGTTAVGPAGVVRGSRERLARIVADQLSPVGRLQVNTTLAVMDALDEHLLRLRRRIVATAEHVAGAQALRQAVYGVGPMTAVALVSWLGGANRFTSSRNAVRFVGLDITVRSSDGKRSPGRLSRQGPEALRWLLFEAAKTSARSFAPAHDYYTTVRQRHDGNRAALSQARRISGRPCTSSLTSATPSPPSQPPGPQRFVDGSGMWIWTYSHHHDGVPPRPAPARPLSDRVSAGLPAPRTAL